MSETSMPTCLNCGYALHGLVESQCPECGRAFDPSYVEQFEARQLLLPWERSEVGGVTKRTIKTIWTACAHPGRFFTTVDMRRDRSIHRSGSFIIACVVSSLAIYVGGIVLNHLTNVVRFSIKSGNVSRALRTVLTTAYYSIRTDWFFPSQEILGWLTAIFLTAAVVFFVLRRKPIGSLRFVDITAAFAPILPAAAMIQVLGMYFVSMYFDALVVASQITAWSPLILFALMTWYCSRRLIQTTWINAAGLSVLGLVIGYYSDWPIRLVLIPLLQAAVATD